MFAVGLDEIIRSAEAPVAQKVKTRSPDALQIAFREYPDIARSAVEYCTVSECIIESNGL
jgi:hypothetical protein